MPLGGLCTASIGRIDTVSVGLADQDNDCVRMLFDIVENNDDKPDSTAVCNWEATRLIFNPSPLLMQLLAATIASDTGSVSTKEVETRV